MAAKFGTSGLRGLATELLDGTAERHVAAFLTHLLAQGAIGAGDAVLIGHDHRDSSPALAGRCAAAIAACGLRPVDCGAVATPALALQALARRAAAVMITGSHIPADRNGLKFYRPDGEVTKADEAAIVARAGGFADAAAWPAIAPDRLDAWPAYAARYAGMAPADALAGWRIGVWQHSSVLRDRLGPILETFGATVVPLSRSEAFVPVDTEAVDPGRLSALAADIRREGLDALLSTDADADRPLILDGEGRQLRGDVAGIITARFLRAGVIVTPVTSNSGAAAVPGAETRLTRVGSPFVIEAMQAALAEGRARVCGFEANGGFLTGDALMAGEARLDPLMTRDSVLPMLAVLLSAAGAGQTLAAHAASLALPHAVSDRLQDVATERSLALVARLTEDAAARDAFTAGLGPVTRIDLTDGLRMHLGNGAVLHLRPSGNAPEMRCYAEAAGAEAAGALLADGLARLRAALA